MPGLWGSRAVVGVVDGEGEEGSVVGLVEVERAVAEREGGGDGPALAVGGDVGEERFGGGVDAVGIRRGDLGGEGDEPRLGGGGRGGEVRVRRCREGCDERCRVGAGGLSAPGVRCRAARRGNLPDHM